MRLIPAGNGESGMRKRNEEAEWESGSESVEEAEERMRRIGKDRQIRKQKIPRSFLRGIKVC